MAEELKNLIEKIQEDGVRAAEEKAKSIEDTSREKAEEIIADARKESEALIREAGEKIARMEKSAKSTLKQAGRDFLLVVRKEINAMLNQLITSKVSHALDSEEVGKIIREIVKKSDDKQDITVALGKEDLRKLEKGLLSELRAVAKKGITLKPSEDIKKGFIISYDAGKSYYDFTDKAIAEYIGAYLKPKLAEILGDKTPTGEKT